MKRTLVAVLAALATATPMSAAMADEGPSLADTLGYIKDKIEAQGDVVYNDNLTDTANDKTWVNHWVEQRNGVGTDVPGCRIFYHSRLTQNAGAAAETDVQISTGLISDIQLLTDETRVQQIEAADHPTWVSQSSPPAWVVHLVLRGARQVDMWFTDQDTADRVAKAFAHAAQLCGGLKPELF